MDPDGVSFGVAMGEPVSSQELLYSEVRGQLDHVGEGEIGQPFGVAADDGLLRIEDLVRLVNVGLCFVGHFLRGLLSPRRILVAGIADEPREIADEEDGLVSQLLELGQLSHSYSMSQMQVWGRGVVAAVDPQWPAAAYALLQPLPQFQFHVAADLLVAEIYTAHDDGKLFVNGSHVNTSKSRTMV